MQQAEDNNLMYNLNIYASLIGLSSIAVVILLTKSLIFKIYYDVFVLVHEAYIGYVYGALCKPI